MDEEKVKKAIKASAAPKDFFRYASALGLFTPYRDSHQPLTEFSNELKYQMPEWLGFVRDAMEDRFFSIISDTEPRRGRLPATDELTALRDIGDYRTAEDMAAQEAAIVNHIAGAWDDAADMVPPVEHQRPNYSRLAFIYSRLEVVATIMAYRPMSDYERIATIRNLAKISNNAHGVNTFMRVLPVHASFIGADREEVTNQRSPALLWEERMGKVAAMIEVFYPDFHFVGSSEEGGLLSITADDLMHYWKSLCSSSDLFQNGRCCPKPRLWYNRITGLPEGIDWNVYKERRTGFAADFEMVMKKVTKFNRAMELKPDSVPKGDLFEISQKKAE